MKKTPPGVVDVIGGLVLLLGAGALAAAAWWPIYEHWRFVLVAGAALLAGALLALAGALFRIPGWAIVIAGFVLFLLAGVPLAVPDRAQDGVFPTVDGLVDLLSAVALGWKRLVTITLPVGEYQALLVPPFALLLLGGIAGPSIAWRTRLPGLAIVPSIVVFLAGIAFGSDRVALPMWLALAMLGVSLAWPVWCRWRSGRAGARTFATGAVILALAAASSIAAVTGIAATGNRQVVRTAVEQPFDPHAYPSPLAGMRHFLQPGVRDAVQFHVDGLAEGGRIRLAVLDSYDGVVYSVGSGDSGVYRRIPSGIERPGGTPTRVDVTVEGYSGVWLPTIGDFESVRFAGGRAAELSDGFGYNLATDSAADALPLRSGDRYSIAASPTAPHDEGDLARATPGSASLPALGELPAGVGATADDWAESATSPGGRLLAMLDGIRANGYLSHGIGADEAPSRSGHGADRISELVTGQRMIGDAEQYSVLAALMARHLGFPARVVLGFLPGGSGSVDVRGADVSAWIEVNTAEYGWVELDVTPPPRPIPDAEPDDPTQVSHPQSVVPPPADTRDPREQQSLPDTTPDQAEVPDPTLQIVLGVLRIGGWTLLGIAVVLAPFALIIAAKLRRRGLRRGRGSALQRIRGGWDEFADEALDRGFSPTPSATRTEFAEQIGLLPARVLAAVADRATFAPGAPDPRDAERVWETVEELRASLDLGRTRWQRLRSLVSLRSLGGYSVRRLFRRERVV